MESKRSLTPKRVEMGLGTLRIQYARWRKTAPGLLPSPSLLPDFTYGEGLFFCFVLMAIFNSVFGFTVLHNVYLLLLFASVVRKKWSRALQISPDTLNALRDLPEVETQFPVTVAIYSDGVPVGFDSGLITFSDEILHYEGIKTTFELPNYLAVFPRDPISASLFPSRNRLSLVDEDAEKGKFRVEWRASDRMGGMEIDVYDRTAGGSQAYIEAFNRRYESWRHRRSSEVGSCTLPPTYPDEEFLAGLIGAGKRRFGMAVICFGVFLLAVLDGDVFAGVVVTGILTWLVVSLGLEATKYRRVRRLLAYRDLKFEWHSVAVVADTQKLSLRDGR